ncbi:hypothetical protein JW865_08125 [Candidatus Bathyarchaeota archaeon]|nr:hypothetical protein [Candidatus Bathyarchaeota archaeon]
MKQSESFWFGGFLFGLGSGWYFLSDITLTWAIFSIFLIFIGGSMILSGLLQKFFPIMNLDRIISGLSGGIILALLITQGLGIINLIPNIDGLGNNFSSTDTKTYSEQILDQTIYLNCESLNGHIFVQTWDQNEYHIEVKIKAFGLTQQEANENLSNLIINMDKKTQNNQLKINLNYNTQKLTSKYSINVDIKLPRSKLIDLNLETVNGEISLENIQSNDIILYTSNAPINLNNIKSNTISCRTSNAMIIGSIDVLDFEAYTSNGKVDLTILNQKSGIFNINTSNALVKIVCKNAASYYADALTSNNSVNFNLPNLIYSVNSNTIKIAKSSNYETATIKFSFTIRTSNASVEISTLSYMI